MTSALRTHARAEDDRFLRHSVRLDWIDDQDERFGAHQLSDGTLRLIALITALAQPTERLPRFISIDEPELGLHPAAITLLAELARSVSRHTQGSSPPSPPRSSTTSTPPRWSWSSARTAPAC